MIEKNIIVVASIFVLMAISFVIGVTTKKNTSVQSLLGSTKLFGPLVTGLSSTAAMVSGMIMVGGVSTIYLQGNSLSLSAFLSCCFSLAYIFIGKKMRAMAEIGEVSSLGDIIDLRYGRNHTIKFFSSAVLFVGCFAYLITQIAAAATLFSYLFGWPPLLTSSVVFGVVILYVLIGGEAGGILSQAFQGLIIVIVGLVLCFLFFFEFGGFEGLMQAIAENPTVAGDNGITANFSPRFLNAFGTDTLGAMANTWILFSFVGVVCQPATLTRMYAIKEARDLPRAGLVSGISQGIACFAATILGYCVIYLVSTGKIEPLARPDEAVWHLADYLGLGMNVLIVSSVMAAIISSASMYLSTSANLLARDVLSSINIRLDERKQIFAYRVAIAVLGVVGILVASLNSEMVIVLGFLGWGMLMTITMPVFVIGMSWKGVTKTGVLCAALSAFILDVIALILNISGFVWPAGLPWYMYVICFTTVTCIVVSMLTKKDKMDRKIETVLDL